MNRGGGGGNNNNNNNNNNNLGDDAMDVELHVAVDELLGIRGPIHVLLRNLLWLLAFNCAYLGLFAFIPFSIGSSVVVAMRRYAFDLPVLANHPLHHGRHRISFESL